MFTPVGLLTIVSSFIGFSQLNNFLKIGWIPVPKKYVDYRQQHKWRNSIGSVLHAAVVGILCTLSIPDLRPDFVNKYAQLGEISLAFSLGYMVYDAFDLMKNKPLNQVWPLLIHHFLVGWGCYVIIWRQEYMGYGIFCSMAEINSVNLHLRQLLLMYDVSKTSTLYRINNTINIITYVFLRLPIFVLIPIYLVADRHRMVGYWNTIMFVGDVILLVVNLVLFKRLLQTDFFGKNRGKNTGKTAGKVEVNGNLMDL